MHTTQNHNLFVTFYEGFNIKTGNKNPFVVEEDSSYIQQSMSSPLVFDSVEKGILNFSTQWLKNIR